MPVRILAWKPLLRGNLKGFADVQIGQLKIFSVGVFRSADGAWGMMPSKPRIGRDGAIVKRSDGKTEYDPVVEWASRETADRFSASLILALEMAHPGALDASAYQTANGGLS